MKIVDETIRRITISGVPNLDPIRVALEDIETGKGRINIECWGTCWANYWGGMGDRTIAEFFATCSVQYLAGKLSSIDSDVFDPDGLLVTLKKEVVTDRRKRFIYKDEARRKFDAIDDLDLPECEAQLWSISHEMYEILGDEWWYSLPKKQNPDYEYLCLIIRTVQDALKVAQGGAE